MKRYDQASKEKRRMLTQNEVKSEIKHLGIEMPMRKGRMLDKKLDAKRCEKQIRKLLIRDRQIQIDLEVRNCFPGGVGDGTIKCAYGYNHCGRRNKKITEECPRCGEVEDWQHIIKCNGIRDLKLEYGHELANQLTKVATMQL